MSSTRNFIGPRVDSGRMPDRHLMVDIETLDTNIDAAIIGIGAVAFNPRCVNGQDEFRVTMSKKSNVSHGRSVSKSTEAWWDMQDEEAKKAVFDGPHTAFPVALNEFARWINRLKPTCTRVWAKSPDFDCSILAHAFGEQGIIWPFKFWEGRCVRTIMELAYPEGDFPYMDMEGPKHDALADAKKQVLEVQHAYHVLGV